MHGNYEDLQTAHWYQLQVGFFLVKVLTVMLE